MIQNNTVLQKIPGIKNEIIALFKQNLTNQLTLYRKIVLSR